jgi:CheY-like chemotaxis protein
VIVEDDPRAAELIAGHLLGVGLGVVFARNAEEGRRMIDQSRPRAITLDINMEGVDGWALLADLKSSPQTADIPVVVISVDDEPQRAELLGAADFLGKPIKKEALYQVLVAHGVPLRSVQGVAVVLVGPEGAELDRVERTLRRAGCSVVRAAAQDSRGLADAAKRADVLVTRAIEDVAGADLGTIPVVAIVDGDAQKPERIVRAVFDATAEKTARTKEVGG